MLETVRKLLVIEGERGVIGRRLGVEVADRLHAAIQVRRPRGDFIRARIRNEGVRCPVATSGPCIPPVIQLQEPSSRIIGIIRPSPARCQVRPQGHISRISSGLGRLVLWPKSRSALEEDRIDERQSRRFETRRVAIPSPQAQTAPANGFGAKQHSTRSRRTTAATQADPKTTCLGSTTRRGYWMWAKTHRSCFRPGRGEPNGRPAPKASRR